MMPIAERCAMSCIKCSTRIKRQKNVKSALESADRRRSLSTLMRAMSVLWNDQNLDWIGSYKLLETSDAWSIVSISELG